MDIAPIPNAPSPEALEQKVRPQTQEPHLPKGHSLGTVQASPMPIISNTQHVDTEHGDGAMRLRTAQAKSEMTGTGGIVDLVV
jgi:hypothetical protein